MPGTRFRKFVVEFPAKLTKEEKALMAKYEAFNKNKKVVQQLKKKKAQGKKLMDLIYGKPQEPKDATLEKIIVIPPNLPEDREFQKPMCQKAKGPPKEQATELPQYTSYDDIALAEHSQKKQKFEREPSVEIPYIHTWDEPEMIEVLEDIHETKMEQERELVSYTEMDLFE